MEMTFDEATRLVEEHLRKMAEDHRWSRLEIFGASSIPPKQAPTGRPTIAQGNALGLTCKKIPSPEGASQERRPPLLRPFRAWTGG